jgi:hypothetical protein
VTGLLALGAHLLGLGSAALWLIYAVAALVMLLAVLPWLPRALQAAGAATSNSGPTQGAASAAWAWCMGCMAWATSCRPPSCHRWPISSFAGSGWPICSGRRSAWRRRWAWLVSLRRGRAHLAWLTATLWLQGLGVLACLMGGGIGLALGVVLCGGPFLACMQLVMQRSRELAPHATQRNAGLLTACFALGQLSGPLLAASAAISVVAATGAGDGGGRAGVAGALALRAAPSTPRPCAVAAAPKARR